MKFLEKGRSLSKNKIFYTWLFSYIIILLIPILSSVIIFFYSNNVVDNQLSVHNETLSRFVTEEYDAIITENLKVSAMLVSSDSTKELFGITKPISPEERLRLFRNYNTVQQYYTQFYNSNSKSSIYFYIKECNFIVGDYKNNTFVMKPQDAFYSLYEQSDKIDSWIEAISLTEGPAYMQIDNNLLYIMPYHTDGNYKGSFIINRKSADVFGQDADSSPLNAEYAVFDSTQNCIFATSLISGIDADTLQKYASRSDILKLDKKRYMIHHNTSTTTGMSYIVGVSDSDSDRLLKTLRLIEIIMILVPIFISLYLVWFVTKRNYIPLERVLKEIQPFAPEKTSLTANGFELLKNIVSNIVTQNTEMSEKFIHHSPELRNNLLHELLIGYTDYTAPLDEILESYDIRFAGNSFAVVVFHIESYDALFTDAENMSDSAKLSMIQFIFKNAFEELANKNHSGYVINVGGKPVLIVSFRDNSGEDEENWLYKTVSYLKTFIAENFSVYFTSAISNVQKYPHGISIAYYEALKALEHRSVMESGSIITQNMLEAEKSTSVPYAYSFNTEQLLANHITTSDYESAQKLVCDLLDNTQSADMRRCLIYNLSGTVIKLLEASKIEDYSQDINTLINFETINDVKETLLGSIRKLCDSKKEQKGNKLCIKVKEIVNKEYKNSNLSIGYIADTLGIHHVYLSSAFKAHTGEGLLDYINSVRIKHSLDLFADASLSVEDISAMVGYSTSKTFIRTFKKIMGVTPAKYRDGNA